MADWARCIFLPATSGMANRRRRGSTPSSGGIFVDMGVHEFDQIRWLSGQEFSRLDVAVASVTAAPESAQVLCTLSGGSTALVSLGRRFALGDVCRVEAFGTHDAEDCRFLWPPDGERVFLDALRRQAEAFAAWVRGGAATGATRPMQSRHLRQPRGRRGEHDSATRHQSDHLDQRRHAGTRRRHSARDVSEPRHARRATAAPNSEASFRVRRRCWGRS